MTDFVCIVHGGAGKIEPPAENPEQWQEECHRGLRNALLAAHEILADNGPALEAVIAAVIVLEDNPRFNAGRGAVFTAAETVELDASVMDGKTGRAGGVTNIKAVRNPVLAARLVMEHTPHTLIAGAEAERLAEEHGLTIVSNDYFYTEERLQALRIAKAGKGRAGGLGTVGAVALDAYGNLAAATSTGGLTNKMPGRVSDSAIIGAGTYAKSGVAAVSCTGMGDVFIRCVSAFDIAAMTEYSGISLREAVRRTLDKVKMAGGSGGVIALGPDGQQVMAFNDPDMFRGVIAADGIPKTAIFGTESL